MSRFTTVIPTDGPAGNIFLIAGTAGRLMRRLNVPSDEITAFYKRISGSKSYAEACAVVEEYFPLDRDDD